MMQIRRRVSHSFTSETATSTLLTREEGESMVLLPVKRNSVATQTVEDEDLVKEVKRLRADMKSLCTSLYVNRENKHALKDIARQHAALATYLPYFKAASSSAGGSFNKPFSAPGRVSAAEAAVVASMVFQKEQKQQHKQQKQQQQQHSHQHHSRKKNHHHQQSVQSPAAKSSSSSTHPHFHSSNSKKYRPGF